MRIKAGDNIHIAIKKVCENNTNAGSIIVLIQREYPERTLDYLKVMDGKNLYGKALSDFFFKDCSGEMDTFLRRLTNG